MAEASALTTKVAPLTGIKVLVVTSGHEVSDARVYARCARSVHNFGAGVVVIGAIGKNIPDDVRVLAVAKPPGRLVRFLIQPWRCIWQARKEEADIVHFHDAEMLSVLPIAKLMWSRSVFIYDVHEDFANLMLIRNWLPNWTKPAVRIAVEFVEKSLSRLADGITGVTPPLTSMFPHREKETTFNYPPRQFYEDCAEEARPPKARKFDLVHLGTLNMKRAAFLCEVLHQVQINRPNFQALIVGTRPEVAEHIARTLPDGCTVLGHTEYKDVPALLGNARLGLDVHPWADPHLRVAIPVKICEYMAAGCAVVGSSMPVLEDVLARCGAIPQVELLKGGTVTEYADAILRTLAAIDSGADPGSRLRTIAANQMVWEREAEKLVSLYLTLLHRKRKFVWEQND